MKTYRVKWKEVSWWSTEVTVPDDAKREDIVDAAQDRINKGDVNQDSWDNFGDEGISIEEVADEDVQG